MSETILHPAALPGHTIASHRAATATARATDWDSRRPMTWDDQGDRDPSVSNVTAWLWKLAALGFSVGIFAMIFAGIRLLIA